MKKTKMESFPDFEENQKEVQSGGSNTWFNYLRHWKWFVLTLSICIALAILYLKKTAPVYEVSAKIFLNDEENNGGSSNTLRSIQEMNLFSMNSNSGNELEMLKTSYIIEQAVRKLGIYVQYYEIGPLRNTELYGADCPISVSLPEENLDKLREQLNFNVSVSPNGHYAFTGIYGDKEYSISATERDSQVILPFGLIRIAPGELKPVETKDINITIGSPSSVASNFLGSMFIEPILNTSTVANLSIQTKNIKLGCDFINSFIQTYNEEDMKDKTLLANNTAEFLNNQLSSLGNELTDVEKRVENFKQTEGLTDISSEAQYYRQRTSEYEQKRFDVETQLGIINDLELYINKKENKYQLLPSGAGSQSTNLNTLIAEYNDLLLQRKRLSRTATENNQFMIDLTDHIESIFKTVQSSISNEKRNLSITQQDLIKKGRENAGHIKSIPRQERQFSDISRQQNIKSDLYSFLLQKKEENILSMTAITPKAKVLDYPRSNGVPVSPKSTIILLLAIIVGVFIPVIIISFKDLLHFTIESSEELKKISSVPILGEIPKTEKSGYIMIRENSTDGFTEMFRLLRTNLMFVLDEPWKKVINIVSGINGEGKTSISVNLALSLALLDKKVLIIGLDIRKPKIDKMIGVDNESGVSQYLSGQMDIEELIRPSGINSNLWVITAGPPPPNPNELLAKLALDELIELYKNKFDYIVIDTPPIFAVSDSLMLNRFADVNLYVIRADYTPRKDILDANDIFSSQRLTNMYFVFNAANMKKSFYTNRYGRGKKFSNGYGYGYGYYNQPEKKNV